MWWWKSPSPSSAKLRKAALGGRVMRPHDDAMKPGYSGKKPGVSRLFLRPSAAFSHQLLQPVHPERV
jgi:hypothetical protein